jgi:glycerate kinase
VTPPAAAQQGPARVLVAPDSFKGTFTAAQVAEAVSAGVAETAVAVPLPVADGGEGTMDVLLQALGGAVETRTVEDPLGRPVRARFALLGDGARAVVETAEASGLGLVDPSERDALRAGTRGTGQLVVAARDAGARSILIAVGGSATTDGGSGAVEAILAAGGLAGVRVDVLCDVTTPFEDAARVFGPQKGADADAVRALTARLHEQAQRLPKDPRGRPRTGAAGGLSGALWAAFDAELVSGAEYVLDAVGFDARVAEAALVIVGEGRLDEQTFEGKILGEAVRRARRAGVPAHGVVGTNALPADRAEALGLDTVTEAPTLAAMTAAGRSLAGLVAGPSR